MQSLQHVMCDVELQQWGTLNMEEVRVCLQCIAKPIIQCGQLPRKALRWCLPHGLRLLHGLAGCLLYGWELLPVGLAWCLPHALKLLDGLIESLVLGTKLLCVGLAWCWLRGLGLLHVGTTYCELTLYCMPQAISSKSWPHVTIVVFCLSRPCCIRSLDIRMVPAGNVLNMRCMGPQLQSCCSYAAFLCGVFLCGT